MGLFDFFKKVAINDAVFGRLVFMKNEYDVNRSYFTGTGSFRPTNTKIYYSIIANESGPSDQQQVFYNKVEDNYDEIIKKIEPMLEKHFKNWREDFEIVDFKKEFVPVALSIPVISGGLIEWEMSFETIHDENHQLTIYFENFLPKEGVQMDG